MKKTIKITDLEAIVKQAHEKVKNLKGGKNADYIPFLAKIDPNLFGIAVCLPTGEVIEAGDTTYVFGIESISKVHTAVLILKQYGAEAVLKKIGADATGLPFNSIMAILLEKDHPSTPWSMPALSVPIVWLSPSVIPIRNGLLLPTIWPIYAVAN